MDSEIHLKIEFSRQLSETEKELFVNSFEKEFGINELKIDGRFESTKLDWRIDFSESRLDKGSIIDSIGEFLLANDEMIINCRLE